MRISKIDTSPSFARKPAGKEMQVYTKSLNQGLELLGKKVDLILHNSSAPAVKSENTGIGSLFSRTTATKLFPFLKEHAISGVQQEPNGLRQVFDNSPYAPESNARNIFMIPLEKLASDEYGNILSKETFNKIVKNNPSSDEVIYPYVRGSYETALREAFENAKGNAEFQADFAKYKEANGKNYEQGAIFRLINKLKGNDNGIVWKDNAELAEHNLESIRAQSNWQRWDGIDKNLYSPKNAKQAKEAEARIAELKSKYPDEIDYYLFQQMLIDKEIKKSHKLSQETGIKITGDSPVAAPAVEEWANQHLFLKDAAIGCPPDFFAKNGQRWGFKYYNPREIFNQDGSLGRAGEALKKRYEEYFASCPGGVRIDHIIGLIDPFIYSTTSQKMTASNSGRIYSVFTGEFKKKNDDEYANILTKIIIPAAEKYGLDKSAIICEDLGDRNIPTERVMKKLKLSGITMTQFDHRSAKAPEQNTIMIGSHDNPSFLEFIEDLFNFNGDKDKKSRFMRKTKLLAEDTAPQGISKEEKKKYLDEIRNDKAKFLMASFTELFTSPAKRIQIFFSDFWGTGKTYNRPGTINGNWATRLGENFEVDYYKAAAEGKAPNMPEVIAAALRNRGLDKENPELMKELDESAKIIATV